MALNPVTDKIYVADHGSGNVARGELLICPEFREFSVSCYDTDMRDLVILFIHLLTTVARLAGCGGVRSVVAESVLVKHQLLILNRSRQRAPNLRFSDRLVAGWCALFMRPSRLIRSAIVLKPSTLLHLHHILTQRKYRLLFSPKGRRKPGPHGPSKELIDTILATKQRNPSWGCPRIAQNPEFREDLVAWPYGDVSRTVTSKTCSHCGSNWAAGFGNRKAFLQAEPF